jgi:hypothetical protein
VLISFAVRSMPETQTAQMRCDDSDDSDNDESCSPPDQEDSVSESDDDIVPAKRPKRDLNNN